MQDAAEPHVHGTRKLILVAIADVFILAELCVAMFYAAQSDDVNGTFIKIFFGSCIPTLLALLIAARMLRKSSGNKGAAPNAAEMVPGSQIAQG